MSPRKAHYQRPQWIAHSIRDKRKSILHGPYVCPKCKNSKLRIQVNKERKEVAAICSCGVEYPLNYIPAFEIIDYYNRFVDKFNKNQPNIV